MNRPVKEKIKEKYWASSTRELTLGRTQCRMNRHAPPRSGQQGWVHPHCVSRSGSRGQAVRQPATRRWHWPAKKKKERKNLASGQVLVVWRPCPHTMMVEDLCFSTHCVWTLTACRTFHKNEVLAAHAGSKIWPIGHSVWWRPETTSFLSLPSSHNVEPRSCVPHCEKGREGRYVRA